MEARLPRRGPLQVDLDDFGRAGADQKEELDVGPALEQSADHPVEFVVDVGDAGEVAFVDDRGGEARFGENHHAGRGLDEMGAGARSHDQKECVLDLAMQPDDARQPAKDLALAAFAKDRPGLARAHRCRVFDWGPNVHGASPDSTPRPKRS